MDLGCEWIPDRQQNSDTNLCNLHSVQHVIKDSQAKEQENVTQKAVIKRKVCVCVHVCACARVCVCVSQVHLSKTETTKKQANDESHI